MRFKHLLNIIKFEHSPYPSEFKRESNWEFTEDRGKQKI